MQKLSMTLSKTKEATPIRKSTISIGGLTIDAPTIIATHTDVGNLKDNFDVVPFTEKLPMVERIVYRQHTDKDVKKGKFNPNNFLNQLEKGELSEEMLDLFKPRDAGITMVTPLFKASKEPHFNEKTSLEWTKTQVKLGYKTIKIYAPLLRKNEEEFLREAIKEVPDDRTPFITLNTKCPSKRIIKEYELAKEIGFEAICTYGPLSSRFFDVYLIQKDKKEWRHHSAVIRINTRNSRSNAHIAVLRGIDTVSIISNYYNPENDNPAYRPNHLKWFEPSEVSYKEYYALSELEKNKVKEKVEEEIKARRLPSPIRNAHAFVTGNQTMHELREALEKGNSQNLQIMKSEMVQSQKR